MSSLITADDIAREIRAYANPARAAHDDKRRHQSSREHWGISAASLDRILKPYVRHYPVPVLLQVAQDLWHTQIFDLMLASARLLSQPAIPASPELWDWITTCLHEAQSWALTDQLARAAWKCLDANPKLLGEIETWTDHSDMWIRRAALICTLPYTQPDSDPTRILTWIEGYLADPEPLIQKAIGRWLRALVTSHPDLLAPFLKAHWHDIPSQISRELVRKLPHRLATTTAVLDENLTAFPSHLRNTVERTRDPLSSPLPLRRQTEPSRRQRLSPHRPLPSNRLGYPASTTGST